VEPGSAQRILHWMKANMSPKGKIWVKVEELRYTDYELK